MRPTVEGAAISRQHQASATRIVPRAVPSRSTTKPRRIPKAIRDVSITERNVTKQHGRTLGSLVTLRRTRESANERARVYTCPALPAPLEKPQGNTQTTGEKLADNQKRSHLSGGLLGEDSSDLGGRDSLPCSRACSNCTEFILGRFRVLFLSNLGECPGRVPSGQPIRATLTRQIARWRFGRWPGARISRRASPVGRRRLAGRRKAGTRRARAARLDFRAFSRSISRRVTLASRRAAHARQISSHHDTQPEKKVSQ